MRIVTIRQYVDLLINVFQEKLETSVPMGVVECWRYQGRPRGGFNQSCIIVYSAKGWGQIFEFFADVINE